MKTQFLYLIYIVFALGASCNSNTSEKKKEVKLLPEPYNAIHNDSEWNNFFTDTSTQRMDIENADTIKFNFKPISEKQFLDFKAHQTGSNYDLSIAREPDDTTTVFTVKTKNTSYKFRDDRYGWQHRYAGYIPEINSHIIITAKEICVEYLLDDDTDEKIQLPTNFDGGMLGILIPSTGKQMLLYASHYDDDYVNFYSHRAEIILLRIGEGKGWHKLTKPRICPIYDWSIEEIVWINDHSIALKVYDIYETEPVFNSHVPVYKYLRTSIKY